MQSPDSQQIVLRFFEALRMLKQVGTIRGISNFTDDYKINRRNLYLLERDPSRNIFQVAWLSYLVRDYGVSSSWLLTGSGGMFSK